jgi:hypothetical protein
LPPRSEIIQLERSFKTTRELLLGRPWQLEPDDYTWTEVELTHLVGGLVRRFLESFDQGHRPERVADYRPYFLGAVGTSGSDDAARRVEEGTNRLVTMMLMLIQLRHLQEINGQADPVPARDLIEPVRFGAPRAALDGPQDCAFVRDLLDGAPAPAPDGLLAGIRASYQDLAWLLEGSIAPESVRLFAEWLLERVFVVEISPADDDFAAEVIRALREPVEPEPSRGASAAVVSEMRLRRSVEGGHKAIQSLVAASVDGEGGEDGQEEVLTDDEAVEAVEAARDVISYLIGAAFGQWDVRIPIPDDLLPTKYESQPPAVLVDEVGHRLDIENRLFAAARVVLDEDAEQVIIAAARQLGYDSLRGYLRGGFFRDHLKRYSHSRRQAPIYWPLGLPSGRWAVWIYAPRISRQLIAEVADFANERLHPSVGLRALADEGEPPGKLHSLRGARSNGAGNAAFALDPDTAGSGDVDETLLQELSLFLEEALRITESGWEPNLDDGAVLCAAPLADLCPSWPDLDRYRQEIRTGAYPWATVARWASVI